jgi:hypothetical protein
MIHARAATRSNRNQKGPAAPATSDTYVFVVSSAVFKWLGIMLWVILMVLLWLIRTVLGDFEAMTQEFVG